MISRKFAILILIGILLVPIYFLFSPSRLQFIGKQFPVFEYSLRPDGGKKTFRGSRPAVVIFLSAQCEQCRGTYKNFSSLAPQFPELDFLFLISENEYKLLNDNHWCKTQKNIYTIGVAPIKIRVVPSIFVLDSTLRICYFREGFRVIQTDIKFLSTARRNLPSKIKFDNLT